MIRLTALALAAALMLAPTTALADPVTDARASYEAAVRAGGPDSPDALMAQWELANILSQAQMPREAVPHWRAMVAAAEARVEAGNPLLVRLQLQAAMDMVQTGDDAEAEALLRAALPHADATFGPGSEAAMLGLAALATIRMQAGDYAGAEGPARASFDIARVRDGGARAAPIALILHSIYVELGRMTDAREVMALANPSQTFNSAALLELAALREAEDWAAVEITARRVAAQLRATGEPVYILAAEDAELTLVDALQALHAAGGPDTFDEAMAITRRVRADREARGDALNIGRAMNTEADLLLDWPGHEDPVAAVALKGQALEQIEAAVGPDHPGALNQRLVYGILLLYGDPERAAPVIAVYYDAYLRGLIPADDWANGATLLSSVLAQTGEPAFAYSLAAGAARDLHAFALAPERARDMRGTIRTHSNLFRAQVEHAWGYGESLGTGG